MLALHAFRLLYMRTRVFARRKWLILSLGWFFVVFVVSIGPLAIQNKNSRGPYFGPAGFWYAACCPSHPIALLILIEGAGLRSRTKPSRYVWNT